MPNIPYPITADSIEELKSQLYEMLRQLFEDKIGGLDLGDVFLNSGDIMSLRLSSTGGLEKSSNNLQINTKSDGGLTTSSAGISIVCKTSGGLATDSSGIYLSAAGGANFSTIACPAGTNPIADIVGDTLTLANGAGISITGSETTDTVSIANTDGGAAAVVTHVALPDPHTQYLKEADYDANTMLVATSDNIPVASTSSQVRDFLDLNTTDNVTFAELDISGTSRLGSLRVGNATNNTIICASGIQTYRGTAKTKLTLRPNLVEKSSKAGGTPTQVYRGINIGYSLPIWSGPAPDEELYWRLRIPVRWDGITDPQFGMCVSLASGEDVGDYFKFSLDWQTTRAAYGETIGTTYSTCYSEQKVLAGRNAQYSSYFVFFTFDANDTNNRLFHGDMLQARVRRVDASDPDITGEVVIWDWASMWPCDKTYGLWNISSNAT